MGKGQSVVDRYIVEVEAGKAGTEGCPSVGPAYRSIFAKDGLAPPLDGVKTGWDIFRSSVEKYPNNRMLGARKIVDGKAGEYVWQTYKEVYEKVLQLGSAMRYVGVEPKGRCGLYGVNCPQWLTAMEACNAHSVYCVPLYDTLGPEAVRFIVQHAEVSIAFVQESKVGGMLASLKGTEGLVKTVISFGDFPPEQKAVAEELGVAAYAWDEFLALGKQNPVDVCPPQHEDVCTIMYTSGTTGEPKGVLITNENLVAVLSGAEVFLREINRKMSQDDVYLSFLPLAHIFDRTMEEQFIYLGASIGYWQGDVKLLLDDLAVLKPTWFCAVPRVFDRIYSGVTSKITEEGGLKKRIFDFGYKTKLNSLKKGSKQESASPLFDLLVFKKIKARLGGNVRMLVSGAAPLASHVEEFLRVSTCAFVVQGYGLTETSAGSFISIPDVISMQGTVGPPLPSIEVRLESVPEMNYDALGATPRGEICIRGKTVFAGYYKREDLTKEVVVDGWFHTGDVGEWQPDGSLKIIDRKKNIFKLSQGEYVAVENLENVYGLCSVIDSIWVYGNSFESCLVGVAVPNQEALENWAKENGETGDFAALCKNPKAKEWILSQLNAVGKKSKLKGFEAIKRIHLEPLPFDLERDLLTPTFKKKRPQLLKYYQEIIDAMYADVKKA